MITLILVPGNVSKISMKNGMKNDVNSSHVIGVRLSGAAITDITGDATASVFVYEVYNNKNCSVTLVNGWNLVSMPCSPSNKTLDYSLASMNGGYVSMHWYDPNDDGDHWKSYNPSMPSWVVQDLGNISIQDGYWLYINKSPSIVWSLQGNITLPTYVYLYNGWNLAGYPSNETKNVTLALQTINTSVSSIHMYNASDTNDPWKVYNPSLDPSFNDLTMLNPFFGYWMNITTNQSSANWTII